MQLQYRGIQYQLIFSLAPTIPGKAIGKYRGAVLTTQYPAKSPISPRLVTLKYRGICYQLSVHHS
jgi:Domain of unknown function (DUF4278)